MLSQDRKNFGGVHLDLFALQFFADELGPDLHRIMGRLHESFDVERQKVLHGGLVPEISYTSSIILLTTTRSSNSVSALRRECCPNSFRSGSFSANFAIAAASAAAARGGTK